METVCHGESSLVFLCQEYISGRVDTIQPTAQFIFYLAQANFRGVVFINKSESYMVAHTCSPQKQKLRKNAVGSRAAWVIEWESMSKQIFIVKNNNFNKENRKERED